MSDQAHAESMDARFRAPELTRKLEAIGYVTSTFEEAKALRHWCEENKARSVIVVTNSFYGHRVSRIFGRVLGDRIRVQVATAECKKYSARDWWKSEEGLIAFNNEWIKTLYYWFRY